MGMFDGPALAYDRFMGRYAAGLSAAFVDFADVGWQDRVLDVGCGTGMLTTELSARVGASRVVGVDPSASYVRAAQERLPDVRIEVASAGDLPFDDGEFDAALAQLVVHFMTDPVSDLIEMSRVTRPGGVVAASVWDHAGGTSPLSHFWDILSEFEPDAPRESALPSTARGDLRALYSAAGLVDVVDAALHVEVIHDSFEEWWEPYTLGVGPMGVFVANMAPERRAALEATVRSRTPFAPFTVTGVAWAARGVVPR